MGDDAADDLTVRALRLAGDELGLADRRELVVLSGRRRRRTRRTRSLDDVCPSLGVGVQVGEAVGQRPAGRPQVMVRVDDRRIGVDDLLDDDVEPRLR